MRTCGQCGATAQPEAQWCGQCYLPFAAQAQPWRQPAYAGAGAVAARSAVAVVAPPGWTAPAGPSSPPGPVPRSVAARDAEPDGRLLDRRAGVLVATAIGLGGLMQLAALALSHVHAIEPASLIRYDIVLTVGLYAVVGAMIVSQVTPAVTLQWGRGPWLARAGVGLAAGVALSLTLLGVVSLAVGHVQPDPRLVLMMSEGDPAHIAVTALLACVAAPLVEEVLFRGLLLESLRPRGTRLAIWVSAGAFAVWHFMPASLVYYAGLGAALGTLYLKRGLVASVAAHVGFNGVLLIAAVSVVLGPSHVVTVGALSVDVPGGWSVDASAGSLPNAGVQLAGPSESELVVVPGIALPMLSASTVAQRLDSGAINTPPGLTFDAAAVTQLAVPAGLLVEVPFTVDGSPATFAVLGTPAASYEMTFVSGGSDRAARDFTAMLESMRPA